MIGAGSCFPHGAPERHNLESPPREVAVVEDDPSMRKSVARLLNAHGFATEVYASAEAFLSCASQNRFGCIVLDIHLSGMSGIELWHRLKDTDFRIKVIFITALDDGVLEAEAMKAGCVAYLHKPFPADVLIGAVNRALGA
ncbi:response regulator [Sinorhizobium medicae]|nr:response regulator [Sinorhizobium medicae]